MWWPARWYRIAALQVGGNHPIPIGLGHLEQRLENLNAGIAIGHRANRKRREHFQTGHHILLLDTSA
jgi:hypothetical protein